MAFSCQADYVDLKTQPARFSFYDLDRAYFRDWFGHLPNEQVFHKILCYQHRGFQQYAESLEGFDDFILSTQDVWHKADAGNLISATYLQESDWERAGRVLSYLKQKYDHLLARQQMAQLRHLGFTDAGMQHFKQYVPLTDFIYPIYHLGQQQQFKHIMLHTNELGSFQPVAKKDQELNQVVGYSTTVKWPVAC